MQTCVRWLLSPWIYSDFIIVNYYLRIRTNAESTNTHTHTQIANLRAALCLNGCAVAHINIRIYGLAQNLFAFGWYLCTVIQTVFTHWSLTNKLYVEHENHQQNKKNNITNKKREQTFIGIMPKHTKLKANKNTKKVMNVSVWRLPKRCN